MPPRTEPPQPVWLGSFGATVERIDIDHLVMVVRKWSLLIAGGVVAAVGLSLLVSRANLPEYEAESLLYLDQPRLVSTGSEGRATIQKLFALGRTYAEFATSDQVMISVQRRLRTNADPDQLRERVSVTPVTDTQLLEVVGRDRSRAVAQRLTATVNAAFIEEMNRYQEAAGVPEVQRLQISTLESPLAVRPPSNEGRTVALTAVLALIIMIGVAFLLEYIQRDPEAEANGGAPS